jgi:hypothetical protein
MQSVKNCADLSPCMTTGRHDPADSSAWDYLFCICDGGGCEPADPAADSPDLHTFDYLGPSADATPGLVGAYSTTASAASTFPNNLACTPASWVNIDNALSDNGANATVTVTLAPAVDDCAIVSDYLQLTGFNFSIPPGSAIYGIAIGLKGNWALLSGSPVVFVLGYGNYGLTVKGEKYYAYDPNAIDQTLTGGSQVPCCGAASTMQQVPYVNAAGADPGGATNGESSTPGWMDLGPGVAPLPRFLNGSMPGWACVLLKPQYKGFPASQLKQTWTADEINSSDFGVFLQWGITGGTIFGQTGVYQNQLDAVGVAVYYVPGVVKPKRRPNVCIDM